MNKNLENICRVCLNSASRNIFEKSTASNDSQFSIPAIGENVSSLDRLVEKLRYVTMLKVSKRIFLFILQYLYTPLRKVDRFLFLIVIVVAFAIGKITIIITQNRRRNEIGSRFRLCLYFVCALYVLDCYA